MNSATQLPAPPALILNDQILFDRPNSIIVCRVTLITEKAVKVDYAVEPVSAYSRGNQCVVYSYACWIPKSVIIDTPNGLKVKTWFARNFKGGVKIKKYYMDNGKRVDA